MIMRRNPIVLAFNIVCLLPKINRKTLEFKLAELPMGGRDAPLVKEKYSESVKLKYLKQYTEKEAHDLVKNYHHPQELRTAFETLDDHYGKPTMVIRESLRN